MCFELGSRRSEGGDFNVDADLSVVLVSSVLDSTGARDENAQQQHRAVRKNETRKTYGTEDGRFGGDHERGNVR